MINTSIFCYNWMNSNEHGVPVDSHVKSNFQYSSAMYSVGDNLHELLRLILLEKKVVY